MKAGLVQSKREAVMIIKRETRFPGPTFTASATPFSYSALTAANSTGEEKTTISDFLPSRAAKPTDKVLAKVIEDYLRYLRSRGRIVVGAEEVARALSLSVSEVERIATQIRGVRVEG